MQTYEQLKGQLKSGDIILFQDDPFNFGSGFGTDYIKMVPSDGCVLVSLDTFMA